MKEFKMITFKEYLELEEGETDPYKKYPRAFYPKTKAETMRLLAKKRLDKIKWNKIKGDGNDGGDSNIGSPVGSSSDNNY